MESKNILPEKERLSADKIKNWKHDTRTLKYHQALEAAEHDAELYKCHYDEMRNCILPAMDFVQNTYQKNFPSLRPGMDKAKFIGDNFQRIFEEGENCKNEFNKLWANLCPAMDFVNHNMPKFNTLRPGMDKVKFIGDNFQSIFEQGEQGKELLQKCLHLYHVPNSLRAEIEKYLSSPENPIV